MKIRLASFIHDSIVDGEGIRSVVFTQGCPHNCPGCHNQKSIPFDGGDLVLVEDVIEAVLEKNLKKVTFSGGEPFVQAEQLYTIAKVLKANGYNLWSYTGFTFEALMRHRDPYVRKFLETLDILVDGRFYMKKKNLEILYRGSTNQRIIDVPASLAIGKCVKSSLYVDPSDLEDTKDRVDDIFI